MPSQRRSNANARGRQQRQGQNGRKAAQQAPVRSAAANDIIGVAVIALAAAMTVSLLVSTPAPVTQRAGELLSLCFGSGALLCPSALILFAITFFVDDYGPISGRVALGLGLIVVSVLSLMSLSYPGAEGDPSLVLQTDVLLSRGGYVGGGIAWALLSTVGFGVGAVILVCIIIVGAVICGFSISGLVARVREQASVANASIQASRARRSEEREARRAQRQRERQERINSYETSYDAYEDDYGPSPDQDDGEMPATTFIGSRKTTVLRRHPAAPAAPAVEQEPAYADPRPERVADRTLRKPASGLRARLFGGGEVEPSYELGDEDEDAMTPVASPAEVPMEPVSTKRQQRRSSKGKASQAAAAPEPKPKRKPIPEFLREQAEGQASFEDEFDFDAAEGLSSPKGSPKKPSKKSSAPAAEASAPAPAKLTKAKAPEGRPGDANADFELPPFDILSSNPNSAQSASSEAELTSTMRRLQSTLAEFGLKSRVVDYVAGPLVTTFQIEMGEGERVNKIVNLEDDIALTLAAESVRIFAPIPGTSRVGIEIPNKKRENVHLGDVLPYAKGGPLEFAVGRDAGGKAVIADLAKMPHLLVAGATGSGKSVMINALIMSILMRDTPKDVRLILVDPKRVEFSGYNGLPHLYVPVVTEPRQAASALQWAVSEMERRLKVFERAGARNIGVYNEMCVSGKLSEMDNPPEPMPFLVIIIDELSDLMMVAGKDVEASIVRIAQLARAAGIHLVLATQRPSADVVTGLIKSNIETRIALSVASSMDSRVILDQTGAERLLGNGDMLFKYRGHRTRRALGCYVSDSEIESVVDHWHGQGEPDYHEEILTQVAPGQPSSSSSDGADADDPLVWEAAQIVVESQLGSTSGLQRRLKVGYARAGRIMDMLEQKGVVGPPDGSKPREVLLDEDGLEQLKVAEEQYREV